MLVDETLEDVGPLEKEGVKQSIGMLRHPPYNEMGHVHGFPSFDKIVFILIWHLTISPALHFVI